MARKVFSTGPTGSNRVSANAQHEIRYWVRRLRADRCDGVLQLRRRATELAGRPALPRPAAARAGAGPGATTGGADVSGTLRPIDLTVEGAVHALQFAGDTLRLTTATPEQLTAAAAFLARALAQFPDDAPPNARRSEAIARLEIAGKAIGAEMQRRAFN